MRTTLKVIASIVIVLSGVIAVIGLFALFADSREAMGTNAAVIGAALSVLMFAGILWMLTEISEHIGSLRERDPKESHETDAQPSDLSRETETQPPRQNKLLPVYLVLGLAAMIVLILSAVKMQH